MLAPCIQLQIEFVEKSPTLKVNLFLYHSGDLLQQNLVGTLDSESLQDTEIFGNS